MRSQFPYGILIPVLRVIFHCLSELRNCMFPLVPNTYFGDVGTEITERSKTSSNSVLETE